MIWINSSISSNSCKVMQGQYSPDSKYWYISLFPCVIRINDKVHAAFSTFVKLNMLSVCQFIEDTLAVFESSHKDILCSLDYLDSDRVLSSGLSIGGSMELRTMLG